MAGEWREVTLSDLAAPGSPITYGVVKPGPEDPNGVLFIRGGDIADGRVRVDQLRTITREVSAPYKRTVLHGGELVVSLVGNPGQLAIVPVELRGANIARQVGLIRLRDDVDARFVKYSLSSVVGQASLDAESRGSVQQVINLGDLRTVHLQLPPLSEQRGIAHILGTLDDKIELNRRMNETLEAIAQALFKSWFVDFDPVRAKSEGRDPSLPSHLADLFADSFEDSELGEIPKGWRVSSVGLELATLLGGTPSRTESTYWEGGAIPWINSGKANEFRITEPSEFITAEGMARSATKLLPERTTIVAITGATLGQVSLLEIEACANQSVVGVLGSRTLPGEFVYFWIRERIEDLVSRQTGGAQQHVNKNDVDGLAILMPSRQVVSAFQGIAGPIFDRIKISCLETRTLAALRDALLPKLISGELRVKHPEWLLEAAT